MSLDVNKVEATTVTELLDKSGPRANCYTMAAIATEKGPPDKGSVENSEQNANTAEQNCILESTTPVTTRIEVTENTASEGTDTIVTDEERINQIKQKLQQSMSLNLLNLPRRASADRPKSPGVAKLTDFQKMKIDYMFDTLYGRTLTDSLSREDFWSLLKTAVKIRDWSPVHPGFRDLQSRIASIWAGLIKGTFVYKPPGGNALVMEITREEWLHYWGDFVEAAMLCNDSWPETSKDGRIDYQCQKDFRDFMFSVLDVNGDGAIDKEEFCQCLSAFGVYDSDSEDSFDRIIELLPRNQSGSGRKWEKYIVKPQDDTVEEAIIKQESAQADILTGSDFDELWFQYLTCKDRNQPGNFILGPSPVYM